MRYGLGFVLTVNASNFRQGFRRAGMEVQRFESKHSRSFQRMQRRQNALARTTTQLVGALSGLYVGVAAFQALTAQTKKYDFEIRGLAAVTKKTRTEMDRMVHSLYKSSAGLKQFSLVEVARASRQLSQAGYAMTAGGHGAKVLEQSLNAVIASFGNLKPDQAINLGINLEKGFGRGKRGISELYDTVGEAVNLFPMQMDQIQIALGYATAGAQNYNQSLESTILALGTLMPIVATASKAGVAYRNTLAGLTKPFTVDFITKHGIALRDATGGYRDAMEIMFDVNEALDKTRRKDLQTRGGETQSLLHRMFGIRGKALFTAIQQLPNLVSQMPGMSHVTKDTDPREAYRALELKLAEGAPGALSRLAGAMSSSAEIIDRRFNATLENAAQTMGMSFLPMVNDAKVAIGDFVESISKSGGLHSVVSTLGSTFAALIPALAVLTASLGARAVGNLTLTAFSTFRAGGPTFSSATPLSTMTRGGGWGNTAGALLGLGSYYDMRRVGETPAAGAPDTRPHEYHRKSSRWGGTHFAWGNPLSGASNGMRILGGVLSGVLNIGTILGMGFAAVQAGLAILDGRARAANAMARERAKQALDEHQRRLGVPSRVAKDFLGVLGFGAAPTEQRLSDMAGTGDIAFFGTLLRLASKHKGDPEAAFLEGTKLLRATEFSAAGNDPKERKRIAEKYKEINREFAELYGGSKARTPEAERRLRSRREDILAPFKGWTGRDGETLYPMNVGYKSSYNLLQGRMGLMKGGVREGAFDSPAITRTSPGAITESGGRYMNIREGKKGGLLTPLLENWLGRFVDVVQHPKAREREKARWKEDYGHSGDWAMWATLGGKRDAALAADAFGSRLLFDDLDLDKDKQDALKEDLQSAAGIKGLYTLFSGDQIIARAAGSEEIARNIMKVLQEWDVLGGKNTQYDITREMSTTRVVEAIQKQGTTINFVNIETD